MTVRILIADASPHLRSVLRWVFDGDDRFTVVGAVAAGDDAVRHARQADVALIDLELEALDGLTVLEQIRASCPEVVVVVHSALSQPFFRAEARARGAAAFVEKGADVDEVVRVVASAVADGPGQREAAEPDGSSSSER